VPSICTYKTGDGLADNDRQIELHGAVDFGLLAARDVGADRFGYALHRFRCYLNASKQPHLFATLIERCLLSHQRLHTPHAGRELRVHDIEFHICRKLPLMAVRAKIPRARQFYGTNGGEYRFRA